MTKSCKSLGDLRSGVLKTGKLKATGSQSPKTSRGVLTSSNTFTCSQKPGVLKDFWIRSPWAGNPKKRGRTNIKGSTVDDRYQRVLKGIRPERLLRVKRIQARTLLLYDDHVQHFLEWCRHRKANLKSETLIDKWMSIFFHALFEDNAPQNTASYTLFGWIALKMVPSKPERDLLPLSRAALSAWRGISPVRSRVGVPPQVVYKFAAFCVKNGNASAAVAVLLQYDLYARPSEILGARGRDLVSPVEVLSSHWGLVFGNSDFGETTKVKAVDDVVFADSPHRPFAGRLLHFLGRSCLHLNVKLFQCTLSQYEDLFRRFSKQYKLPSGLFTPHCIRHSGPSFDAIHSHKTFAEIQARGRWACAASINRYKKPGRLLLQASRLPSALQKFSQSDLDSTLTFILSHKWVVSDQNPLLV